MSTVVRVQYAITGASFNRASQSPISWSNLPTCPPLVGAGEWTRASVPALSILFFPHRGFCFRCCYGWNALADAIEAGFRFRDDVLDLLAELSPKSPKDGLVLRFLSVALQHQHSIVVLIDLGDHDSSAMALLRCLVDTRERGIWVLDFADDQQVETILTGDFDFKAQNIPHKLSEKHNSKIPKAAVDLMHSFTRTGYEQLSRQCTDNGSIQPTFEDGFLAETIKAASAQLAGLAVSVMLVDGIDGFCV